MLSHSARQRRNLDQSSEARSDLALSPDLAPPHDAMLGINRGCGARPIGVRATTLHQKWRPGRTGPKVGDAQGGNNVLCRRRVTLLFGFFRICARSLR